jgi:hypothetical protein
MARARATPSQAGLPRPAAEPTSATPAMLPAPFFHLCAPASPTRASAPASAAASTPTWTKIKGRCGTAGCNLKDFHEGLCSHQQLDGTERSRKRATPDVVEYPDRPNAKARHRQKKLRADHGVVAEVERLLACRSSRGNKRQFAVRWKGQDAKHDSWEHEDDVSPALIEEFDQHMYKATWNGALFLVDSVLAHRTQDGRGQSRVEWCGYDWQASWVDDDQLVSPAAPTADTAPGSGPSLVSGAAAAAVPRVTQKQNATTTGTTVAGTKFCIQSGPVCGKIPRKARFCPECGAAQQ